MHILYMHEWFNVAMFSQRSIVLGYGMARMNEEEMSAGVIGTIGVANGLMKRFSLFLSLLMLNYIAMH